MMIAVDPTARSAAFAAALAALAVSATLVSRAEPAPRPAVLEVTADIEPMRLDWCKVGHRRDAQIGPIAAVGTPAYELVVANLDAVRSELVDCATSTTRVTVFAHIAGGTVTEATALGEDTHAAACARAIIARTRFSTPDELDLMIPIDLVE